MLSGFRQSGAGAGPARDWTVRRALRLASALALVVYVHAEAAAQTAEPAPDEIVVNATRGKCKIVRAGLAHDNQTLTTFAKGWPNERPVRIVSPVGANYRCLAKIAFKLQRQGIRHVEFVDAPAID